MIQNCLDSDLRPLNFYFYYFYVIVLFSYRENFYPCSSLSTSLEIANDEISANVQNATPLPQTSSIDPVESYINGVKMLLRESNMKGIHTPMPIRVS